MAKRFTSTEIWSEDWFLDMPAEYKLFWHYMLANCNHAGLFKVNLRSFCSLNGVNVAPSEALLFFNAGKDRIRVLSDGLWLVEDFFSFQYGPTFNPNNRVHKSIEKEYKKAGVCLTSIRGLKDLKDGVKDKDKDKDKDLLEDTTEIQDAREDFSPVENSDGLPPIVLNPNRPNHAPKLEEAVYYFASVGAPDRMRKFFEHYESNGWVDGQGRPIAHWQSRANQWISRDIETEKKASAKDEEAARKKAEREKPKSASSSITPADILRQRHPERYLNT